MKKSKYTVINTFKYEFKKSNRGLEINKPHRFAISQWETPESSICKSLYLTYRWLLAVFILAVLIISIIGLNFLGKSDSGEKRIKWPIYVTNWALLTLVIQLLLAAVIATSHRLGITFENKLIYKIYWISNTISNTFAPVVSLGYWLLVYNTNSVIDFLNVSVHILNTVITVFDLFVVCHPVRLLHMYQPALVVSMYVVFTGIYYIAGGTNRDLDIKIYPYLDWEHHPIRTCALAIAFAVILILLHVFIWLIYLIRKHVAIFLLKQEIDDVTEDEVSENDINKQEADKQAASLILNDSSS